MLNKEVAFHVHTTKSDGLEEPKKFPRLAQKVGIEFVVFTDHDNSEAADEAIEEAYVTELDTVSFVYGAEISTAEGHLVVVAKDPFNVEKIPMLSSLEKTIGRARAMEPACLIITPHVGFGPPPVSISPSAIRRLEKHDLLPDGIEVQIPYFRQKHILQAEKLSSDFGLARMGAEDDHLGNFGRRTLTSFPGETLDDFFEAIKNRTTGVVKKNLPLRHIPARERAVRIIRSWYKGLGKKIMNSPTLVQTWIELLSE